MAELLRAGGRHPCAAATATARCAEAVASVLPNDRSREQKSRSFTNVKQSRLGVKPEISETPPSPAVRTNLTNHCALCIVASNHLIRL